MLQYEPRGKGIDKPYLERQRQPSPYGVYHDFGFAVATETAFCTWSVSWHLIGRTLHVTCHWSPEQQCCFVLIAMHAIYLPLRAPKCKSREDSRPKGNAAVSQNVLQCQIFRRSCKRNLIRDEFSRQRGGCDPNHMSVTLTTSKRSQKTYSLSDWLDQSLSYYATLCECWEPWWAKRNTSMHHFVSVTVPWDQPTQGNQTSQTSNVRIGCWTQSSSLPTSFPGSFISRPPPPHMHWNQAMPWNVKLIVYGGLRVSPHCPPSQHLWNY